MKYTKKLAIVPTENNKTVNVTVTEGVGSGLVYVQNGPKTWQILSISGEKQSIALIKNYNEEIVQHILEELATLTDWNQEWQTIRIDLFQKYAYIEGRIEQACTDAINKAKQNIIA